MDFTWSPQMLPKKILEGNMFAKNFYLKIYLIKCGEALLQYKQYWQMFRPRVGLIYNDIVAN